MTNFQRRTLKILIVIIILLTPILVLKIIFAARYDYSTLDEPEIFSLTLPEDTKYSAGYTHDKFGQIKLGMTEKRVIEILGEPLTRWKPYRNNRFYPDKNHFVGLQYSESQTGTNYRLRQIYLDNGVVAEIINYFYVD